MLSQFFQTTLLAVVKKWNNKKTIRLPFLPFYDFQPIPPFLQ